MIEGFEILNGIEYQKDKLAKLFGGEIDYLEQCMASMPMEQAFMELAFVSNRKNAYSVKKSIRWGIAAHYLLQQNYQKAYWAFFLYVASWGGKSHTPDVIDNIWGKCARLSECSNPIAMHAEIINNSSASFNSYYYSPLHKNKILNLSYTDFDRTQENRYKKNWEKKCGLVTMFSMKLAPYLKAR